MEQKLFDLLNQNKFDLLFQELETNLHRRDPNWQHRFGLLRLFKASLMQGLFPSEYEALKGDLKSRLKRLIQDINPLSEGSKIPTFKVLLCPHVGTPKASHLFPHLTKQLEAFEAQHSNGYRIVVKMQAACIASKPFHRLSTQEKIRFARHQEADLIIWQAPAPPSQSPTGGIKLNYLSLLDENPNYPLPFISQGGLANRSSNLQVLSFSGDCSSLCTWTIGYHLYILKKYEACLQHIKGLHKFSQKNEAYLQVLADCLTEQGAYQDALCIYDDALKLNPESLQLHNNRGLALSRIGLLEEAQKEYDLILDAQPAYGLTRFNLGKLQQNQFSLEKFADQEGYQFRAEKNYLESLSFLEKDEKIAVYNQLGTLYAEMKNVDRAEDSFSYALEESQGDPNIYYNRGKFYFSAQKYEEALFDFLLAAESCPAQETLYSLIILTLLELDKGKEALGYLDQLPRETDLLVLRNKAHVHQTLEAKVAPAF